MPTRNKKITKKQQAEIRDILERELNKLTKALGVEDVVEERTGGTFQGDAADIAALSAGLEANQAFKQRGGERLREILDALERLNSGNYGGCEQCGGNIAFERLEIIPTTACCKNCRV